MLEPFPGSVPGYTDFYAQSLLSDTHFDLQCENETLATGSCVLQLPLQVSPPGLAFKLLRNLMSCFWSLSFLITMEK